MQAKVSAPQKKALNVRTGWQEQKVKRKNGPEQHLTSEKKNLQNFSSFLSTIKQRAMGFQNPVRKFPATYN
jgi:hypothetical protein